MNIEMKRFDEELPPLGKEVGVFFLRNETYDIGILVEDEDCPGEVELTCNSMASDFEGGDYWFLLPIPRDLLESKLKELDRGIDKAQKKVQEMVRLRFEMKKELNNG